MSDGLDPQLPLIPFSRISEMGFLIFCDFILNIDGEEGFTIFQNQKGVSMSKYPVAVPLLEIKIQ